MMQYRRLGRTNLPVSIIGMGTAQLRLVPEQQAIDTLRRGISLGVNIIHTAPDYEGTDDLVADAVSDRTNQIIVCTQGYGDRSHLEWLFEEACRKFKKRRLELFGIACIDDRELLGENVWGPGGQIEFLQKMKRKGRLQGIFCTTHGSASYIRKLLESNFFDALIVAYNPLGFHLLSYNQKQKTNDFHKEDVRDNQRIFPLAAQRNIGLMIMKPLGGGLLCRSQAFPPFACFTEPPQTLRGVDVLRFILWKHPEVSCLLPGTGSVEEAQENAMAGHAPFDFSPTFPATILEAVARMRASLCNRCGFCEERCSKKLPISWLFRAAYISNYRSMTFETLDSLQYEVLHPWGELVCESCADVTCKCPSGIDIPLALLRVHRQMTSLKAEGLLPIDLNRKCEVSSPLSFAGRLVSREIPPFLEHNQAYVFRLVARNTGTQSWVPSRNSNGFNLDVYVEGKLAQRVPTRAMIPPGQNGHFVFQFHAPRDRGVYVLRFALAKGRRFLKDEKAELLTSRVEVR